LSAEREESYSDWLAWILGEVKSGAVVLTLLGIHDPKLAGKWDDRKPEIKREFTIRTDQTRRLDIHILFGEEALVIVEVKKTSADVAETEKQVEHLRWLNRQSAPVRCAILLAVGESTEEDCKGFEPLSWETLCANLRCLLPSARTTLGLVTASMFAAFISAAESNLLNLVAPGNGQHGKALLYARTADHIERSLAMMHHGAK
jgi:hypothetical protein